MRMGTQQYSNQDRYVKESVAPRTWTLLCSVWCINLKNSDTNYSFLYLLSLIICERAGKIIARTLCFRHQSICRPINIFNNDAYFLDFRAQIFPLIVFNLNPF